MLPLDSRHPINKPAPPLRPLRLSQSLSLSKTAVNLPFVVFVLFVVLPPRGHPKPFAPPGLAWYNARPFTKNS